MTTTLLFHLQKLASLRASRWSLLKEEDEKIREIQFIIQEQARINDEIFLWEKAIQKIRAEEKLTSPMKESDKQWSLLKRIKKN